MTDRREGPPPRPLPPVDRPSPLDALPPSASGLAVYLAEEEARDLIRRSAASGSLYRLALDHYGPVVEYLLSLPEGELDERVRAHEVERERRRREAQAEERARKLGRPDPSKASLSYAEILGREPQRVVCVRSSEDEAERREREAIQTEGAA